MPVTRESILALRPPKMQSINVPEWGGEVFVKVMNGFERDSYENQCFDEKGDGRNNMRGLFLCRVICDEKGQRLFSDGEAVAVGLLPINELQKVWDAATALNKLTKPDIESLEKN